MPCFRPLRAFKTLGGDVVFNELARYDITSRMDLACGRCIGCRLDRAHDWAVRCMHEASLHERNCFVTLTYEKDEHAQTLRYRDFQLFIRRVRKHIARAHKLAKKTGRPKPLRYYVAGEYGPEGNRAHFHACIFGWDFEDRQEFKRGQNLYTSKLLNKLWGHGFTTVGDVNYQTASYCARYITEKITGDLAKTHYQYADTETGEIKTRTPEFNKMSLKPGIGAAWLKKFTTDVYPHGLVVVNGRETRPPKYYDKLHKRAHPDDHENLAWQRERRALTKRPDNTDERLRVKEAVQRGRLRLTPRNKT